MFEDTLVIVGRRGHPLSGKTDLTPGDLAKFPWVVPRSGTPTRTYFETLFEDGGTECPDHIIESSSLMMIRGLLLGSDRLTIISQNQVRHEEEQHLLERLEFDTSNTARPIGITMRKEWQPTAAQAQMLALLRAASKNNSLAEAALFKN